MENLKINLQKTFSKVFEPIPHVNDLPIEPLTCITLKDAKKIIKTKNTLVYENGKSPGTCYSSNTWRLVKFDHPMLQQAQQPSLFQNPTHQFYHNGSMTISN
jgi:hypothetical protein